MLFGRGPSEMLISSGPFSLPAHTHALALARKDAVLHPTKSLLPAFPLMDAGVTWAGQVLSPLLD